MLKRLIWITRITWIGLANVVLRALMLLFPSQVNRYFSWFGFLPLITHVTFWLGYGILVHKDQPLIKYSALVNGTLAVLVSTFIYEFCSFVFLWTFLTKGIKVIRMTAALYGAWLILALIWDCMSLITPGNLLSAVFPVFPILQILMCTPFFITLIRVQKVSMQSEASN